MYKDTQIIIFIYIIYLFWLFMVWLNDGVGGKLRGEPEGTVLELVLRFAILLDNISVIPSLIDFWLADSMNERCFIDKMEYARSSLGVSNPNSLARWTIDPTIHYTNINILFFHFLKKINILAIPSGVSFQNQSTLMV